VNKRDNPLLGALGFTGLLLKRKERGRKKSPVSLMLLLGSEETKKSVHEHYLKNKKVYDALAKL
jgi:hypothetical protein